MVLLDSFPFIERCTKAPERRIFAAAVTSSRVSVTARLERRSGPSGCCERRDTASRVVRLLCCFARRRTRLLGVATALPRGTRSSRESLTQDSRSAVKARSSVTRIIRRGALHPLQSWCERPLKETVTWVEALGHARKRRGNAETVPMRAYVTGSDDARDSRVRAGYGLTPRSVGASSRLAAHERREGLAQHAASQGAVSRVGLG